MFFSKSIPEISPSELQKRLSEYKIVDVRRPDEFQGELGHIEGAVLATLETDLEGYLDTLPKDQAYAFVCRSGGRSGAATQMALKMGFKNVINMSGGMIAWNQAGLEVTK